VLREEGEGLEGRRRRREREGERRWHFVERVRDDVCVWVGALSREGGLFRWGGVYPVVWFGRRAGSWVTSGRYVIVFWAIERWGHLAERLAQQCLSHLFLIEESI
jgi:hypothetical protein